MNQVVYSVASVNGLSADSSEQKVVPRLKSSFLDDFFVL
jgi:hypothetical protein